MKTLRIAGAFDDVAAAAKLRDDLRDGVVELDWSVAGPASDEALRALTDGLSLETHTDALGAATMPEALASRIAALLATAAGPRATKASPKEETRSPSTRPQVWAAATADGAGIEGPPRDHLVRALHADLIGPYRLDEEATAPQEVLSLSPSRHYLTGFLVPEGDALPDDEDDDDLDAGPDDPEEDTPGLATAESPRRPNTFPASMGMSLLVPAASKQLEVVVRFARYEPEMEASAHRRQGTRVWRRQPREEHVVSVPLDAEVLRVGMKLPNAAGLRIEGQIREVGVRVGVPKGTRAVAVFLVNRKPGGDPGRRDEQMIFQVELEVACAEGFVRRPNITDEKKDDWDERVSDIQFREHCEFAVGHNVATAVDPGDPVTRVRTTWIPQCEVRRVKTHEEPDVEVAMEDLADLKDADEVRDKLGRLPDRYATWIAEQRKVSFESAERRATRDELMDQAADACARIRRGIELCAEDRTVRRAFSLANRAMALAARKRKPDDFKKGERPRWRLFQLAFVLQNLEGLADPEHPDRERVELVFFPTGGGKTEAYLGVIAFALVLRRLRRAKVPDAGLGVAVVLRYTLRLLTLDQLDRAATLICALESERRNIPAELGDVRFAVGLWVGRSATANTLEEVSKAVSAFKVGTAKSPFPLAACPWCREPIKPSCLELRPRTKPEEVRVTCLNEACEFAGANNDDGLPVLFVDEQVYRELPCFLIATVDKFAMMPWRGEIGMLFGKVTARDGRRFMGPLDGKKPATARPLPTGLLPPDLIVQDELHLISGPLGTMVGLYETAIDELSSRTTAKTVVRPKVLAATATVRRARSQIQALFGRKAHQVAVFPPPGVDDSESFFAELDTKSPGRLYVGVAAQGRSMKGIAQRVYRALLAAAKKTYDGKGAEDQVADGYMTLAGYFNSLRELGGMRRLVEDEVLARTKRASDVRPRNEVGPHRWFENRDIGLEPVELTSREHTSVVKGVRDRLGKTYRNPEAIHVLLASNMISVGVDIDRLGLMVVTGQPKTTAEYIQASSRVGRTVKWPGLVVTLYNLHKPRDRSHYEHFAAYHESFYRHVEASSVTPFSGPALERGLAGVLVAMTRFGQLELTPGKGATDVGKYRRTADAAVAAVAARAGQQPEQPAEAATRAESELRQMGANLIDQWVDLVVGTPSEPGQRRYSPFDRDKTGGRPLLLTAQDPEKETFEPAELRFVAPTSMRDVEATSHLWMTGRRFSGGGG